MIFDSLNKEQLEAVTYCDGPLLIIAGPGTGKTFTMVKKVAYLLIVKKIRAESIIITTFTIKAANELKIRIAEELKKNNFIVDINKLKIGTIHSLCQKIIFGENYILLDEVEQRHLIHKNLDCFRKIEGFNSLIASLKLRNRNLSIELYNLFSKFSESGFSPETLYHNKIKQIQTIGILYSIYLNLLDKNSIFDFSKILTQCNKILSENKFLLEKFQDEIQYILVDEFQDTNNLQWEILLKLAGERKNICVVGDDDQAIYRFRGASTKNILGFPNFFKDSHVKIIKLQTNYRSSGSLIDFYSNFMNSLEWKNSRYEKALTPFHKRCEQVNSVFKITHTQREKLNQKIGLLLLELKESGKIEDYSQVAFLFRSVKSKEAKSIINYLNKIGIKTYSPRSGDFFNRKEIRFTLGIILLLFKDYHKKLSHSLKYEHNTLSYNFILYTNYEKMISYALHQIEAHDKNLKIWIHEKTDEVSKNRISNSFLKTFYELFQFNSYQELFSKSRIGDRANELVEKNIAILANIIENFEKNGTSVISEEFFDEYLPFLMDNGINEYEDSEELLIEDHVSFLTFHQSKGLEFPVTIIGSLDGMPEKSDKNSLNEQIRENLYHINRNQFEQDSLHDFFRIYYTAFSRAKNLMFLISEFNDNLFPKSPSTIFKEVLDEIPEFNLSLEQIKELEIEKISKSKNRKSYSFTGDISLYLECPIKYRFLRKIGFPILDTQKELLGILVHKSIDDIHKQILKGSFITEEFSKVTLRENYDFLRKKFNLKLDREEANSALKQVNSYLENFSQKLPFIEGSEIELSSLRKNYVMTGVIDLILKNPGIKDFSILDFKTSKITPQFIPEIYKKQLLIYKNLAEENGYPISNLSLYYTAKENNPLTPFKSDLNELNRTLEEFDDTVEKIEKLEFFSKTSTPSICPSCQFRFFCEKILF